MLQANAHLLGLLMWKAGWSSSAVTALTLPGTLEPACSPSHLSTTRLCRGNELQTYES